MKQIRRIVLVPCTDCFGTGKEIGGPCSTCKGKGEIERPVVEFIHDENAPVPK